MGFLILTRRPGEEIVFTLEQALPIGTQFRLVLVGRKGNQVRFGIDAPKSISVDRIEVAQRKYGNVDGNKDE